jgi:hypothetical protein
LWVFGFSAGGETFAVDLNFALLCLDKLQAEVAYYKTRLREWDWCLLDDVGKLFVERKKERKLD